MREYGRNYGNTLPQYGRVYFTQNYSVNSELCLIRVKPPETVVEARSGPDVQIGRKN